PASGGCICWPVGVEKSSRGPSGRKDGGAFFPRASASGLRPWAGFSRPVGPVATLFSRSREGGASHQNQSGLASRSVVEKDRASECIAANQGNQALRLESAAHRPQLEPRSHAQDLQ